LLTQRRVGTRRERTYDRRVLQDHSVVSADEAAPPGPRAVLSPRETEVLDLASLGLTNQQIATRLHVSVHAVKFHLAGVYRKLGAANRTEAVFRYLRAEAAS
jgi:DNA-binding CsgD family transcriptional regulator